MGPSENLNSYLWYAYTEGTCVWAPGTSVSSLVITLRGLSWTGPVIASPGAHHLGGWGHHGAMKGPHHHIWDTLLR